MSTPGPSDNPFEGMPIFGDLSKLFAGSGPVNWDVARQLAVWLATEGTAEPNVPPLDRMRVEELFRVAELNITEATGFTPPSGMVTVRVVGRADWATRTLDAWKPLLLSLAESLSRDGATPPDVEGLPPDAMAGLLGNLSQMMSPMLLGMQSGMMVGHLAQRALGQYDLPIPRTGDEVLIAPANLDAFAADWSLPVDDVRLWVCLTELTHHLVLSRPHVHERMTQLLIEYVGGFVPDPGFLEAKLADVDPTDPDAVRHALGDPEALLGAMQSPEQLETMARLQALVAAVVGYVDHVLDEVGRRLVSSYPSLSEAIRRRRVERGDGDKFVERLFGLELGQREVDRGGAFVRGVVERAGDDGLVRLWRSARELPTPAEIDAPGLWLERIDIPE